MLTDPYRPALPTINIFRAWDTQSQIDSIVFVHYELKKTHILNLKWVKFVYGILKTHFRITYRGRTCVNTNKKLNGIVTVELLFSLVV